MMTTNPAPRPSHFVLALMLVILLVSTGVMANDDFFPPSPYAAKVVNFHGRGLSSTASVSSSPPADKRHKICGVFAAKAGLEAKIDAFHTAPKLFQVIDQGFASSSE